MTLSDHAISTEQAPKPVGLYPHARKVGNLLFLSGVGPRKAGTDKIPGVELDTQGNIVSYDIEAQCHSVFQNISTILAASNANWMDLVDITVFLTNMDDDFATYNRIYAEYFSDKPPARAVVEVARIPRDALVEIMLVAQKP